MNTTKLAYTVALAVTVVLIVDIVLIAKTSNPVGNVTCNSFYTHADAQKSFEKGYTKLDGDNDGVACERLMGR